MNDRTYGQQFRARFIRTAAPLSVEGIEKYLGSGMIRGIGPVYARKFSPPAQVAAVNFNSEPVLEGAALASLRLSP